MNDLNKMNLAQKLKCIREWVEKKEGISKNKKASFAINHLGVSYSSVDKWEKGQRTPGTKSMKRYIELANYYASSQIDKEMNFSEWLMED